MKKVILISFIMLISVIVYALEWAIPTESGARIVKGTSSEMKATPVYGYPVPSEVRSLPEKYRIIENGRVRPKTQEERDAINSIMVTNIVFKPSLEFGGIPVQEAEQTYVGLYTAIYGDNSYTNAQWAIVAVQLAHISTTNDWVATRLTLIGQSFDIIEAWWKQACLDLRSDQATFHPYPWGQTTVTNIVQRWP